MPEIPPIQAPERDSWGMPSSSGFFDGETGGPVQVVLELQEAGDFKLRCRIGYRDPRHGPPFLVPKDPERFRTDLTSVPWPFAWLVPSLGTHLLAALLHDGLVVPEGADPTHEGDPVSREEADRIFRDAMAGLGVPRLRRWLIWTAVMLATAWQALVPRWRWRTLVVVTFGGIGVLGTLATLDLLDLWDVLPWMGDQPWWAELLWGAAFALVIPLGLSMLWGRRWPVAAVGGVAAAFLFHVTLAVVAVFSIYWLAEQLVSGPEGTGPNIERNLARRR